MATESSWAKWSNPATNNEWPSGGGCCSALLWLLRSGLFGLVAPFPVGVVLVVVVVVKQLCHFRTCLLFARLPFSLFLLFVLLLV